MAEENGDDQRFDAVASAYGAALLRLAYLLSRDAARAEDLVQDALIKSLALWRKGATPEHPEAYLRRVVLNEYLGWRRRRWSTEVVSSPLVDDAVAVAADAHAASDERDLMWRLLGTLAPRARAVLVLRYYEGLTDREIAGHLGCAEATVRSVAARAFATLRADAQLADLAPRPPAATEPPLALDQPGRKP